MKKLLLLLLICFIAFPSIYADDSHHAEGTSSDGAEHPSRSRSMDRGFEIAFDINAVFSNNLLTIGEVFSETITIDINRVTNGLMASLGVGTAFSINIDSKKGWGFGLSLGAEGTGVFDTGGILSLNNLNNEALDFGGALFVVADINTFFEIQKFKVTFNPSMFWAAAYFNPNIRYSLNTNDGIDFSYTAREVRIYTAMPYEQFMNNNIFELTGSPGFDVTLGVEYPLAKELGLSTLIPLLDFDVGVELHRIPIIPSVLRDYYGIRDTVSGNIDVLDFFGGSPDLGDGVDTDFVSGRAEASFERTFKMLIYANWRPLLGSKLLTVTPVLGLSNDFLYSRAVSFEGGVSATLNLADIFYATAGISYFDRVWINSLDLAVNLRAFQLDLGVDMRSQDFIRSWTAGGVGVRVGLRFGW
ncbi:MAG: hypothetical protein FWC01_06850 [Treponema sp.]|nr:hypothetical protein [Treponema sp.]MCL2237697.1 hypothetical protein [Treponema sp.]